MALKKRSSAIALLLLLLSPIVNGKDCDVTSVNLTPLNDLGSGLYLGFEGGLYPGGTNSRPAEHESAGLDLARAIEPLDGNGDPDPNGKYVMISIGMSNTHMEFERFVTAANEDTAKNPNLVIVDGAQPSKVASVAANPDSSYWSVLDSRLSSAGVTGDQVVVAWVKQANRAETPTDIYRDELQDNLEEIARNLKSKYPNLSLVYYSSRIYGGYSTTELNPEPYAYESGFVVKWVIEKQLGGAASLNFDPGRGTVNAPWMAWGPYLWADGLSTRSDGLQWECSDVSSDGVHPSTPGERKVASILLDFFKTDTTAREWFGTTVDRIAPAAPQDLMIEP